MIEKKLQAAANALPEPRGDFLAVEEQIKKKQRVKSTPRKRLAALLLLAVLLVGCVAVTTPDYHLYNGNWWQFTPLGYDLTELFAPQDDQTQAAAKKLGITLPETLGGYPVIDYGRYNLTDQDVPIWLAWLSPRYVYQSSFYGYEAEEPWVSPDGVEGTIHRQVGAQVIYGPTNDEIWRRQFGFNEQDIYTAGNYILSDHQPEEITFFEYEGFTVYVGNITIRGSGETNWVVTWVDHAKGAVFSIDGYFDTPDSLIEYAKEIIGLNK